MRKALILLLVLAFTIGAASSAVAAPPASWNPPGPSYRTDTAAWAGEGPHKNYAATGDKCEICHSPHQAGDGSGASWKLLHDKTRDAACDYCHVGAAAKTGKKVYTLAGSVVRTGKNGHEIAAFSGGIPDATTGMGAPNIGAELDCFDCHSPHGAKALAADILRKDPGNNGGTDATDETSFCADCHNKNYRTTGGFDTHIMTDIYPGPNPPSRSNTSSKTCGGDAGVAASCHAATRSNLYPHISTGDALLKDDETRAAMDRACLRCHGSSGKAVGTDY